MACNSIEPDINLTPFDRLEQLIHATYNKIVSVAVQRRDRLLDQLHEIRILYLTKEETRLREIRDLEKMIGQLSDMSVQQNKIAKMHEEHIFKMKDEKEQSQTPTPFPIISFNSSGLNSILKNLEKLGTLEDTKDLYKGKIQPIKSFGKEGAKKGELNLSLDISIDENKRIYIADHWNKRVQVFTLEGKFIAEIGKGHLKCPYSLDYFDEHIFVSDWNLNTIFKFELTQNKLVCKSDNTDFCLPFGLTVDTNGEVLVADMKNNRIAVCTANLKIIGEIGKDKLKFPRAVLIQLDQLIIADNNEINNIHIFAKTGEFLKSVIKLENGTDHIFMCLDKFSNILVSDDKGKSIQIYNNGGDKLHRIESKGYPRGILECNEFIICSRFENVVDFY